MISNGLELALNEYGLEFDSFLGAIYLPWHTIIITALLVLGYKAYKTITKRRTLGNCLPVSDTNDLWSN
jgi:hypothetical protein